MLPSLAPPVASSTAMVKFSVSSGILNKQINRTDIYMKTLEIVWASEWLVVPGQVRRRA